MKKAIFLIFILSGLLFSCAEYSKKEREEIKIKIAKMYKNVPSIIDGQIKAYLQVSSDGSFNQHCVQTINNDALLSDFFTKVCNELSKSEKITIENANYLGFPVMSQIIGRLDLTQQEAADILKVPIKPR
jgi:hypothetical protein